MSETYQSLKPLKDRMEKNLPEEKDLPLLNKKRIENKAKKDVRTPKNFNRINVVRYQIEKGKTPCVGVKKKRIGKASSIVVREKREKSTPVEIKEEVVNDGVDHENNTEFTVFTESKQRKFGSRIRIE